MGFSAGAYMSVGISYVGGEPYTGFDGAPSNLTGRAVKFDGDLH